MGWNYRVVRKDGQCAVHEVFYDEAGRVSGCTEDPVFPRGDTPEDLAEDFGRYQRALTEPVLDYYVLQAEGRQLRQELG